jgi:hypothetical protein
MRNRLKRWVVRGVSYAICAPIILFYSIAKCGEIITTAAEWCAKNRKWVGWLIGVQERYAARHGVDI